MLHIIKYLSDPPTFALVTPTQTIPLGGADGILVWDKFRLSLWQVTGHQIDRFSKPQWDRVTKLVPRAWEEQDVGAEATERGEVASWLTQYLSQRPPAATLEEATASEYPYVMADGRIAMFGPAFKRWLFLTFSERLNNREMGRRLRAFSCDPDKVNVEDSDGKRTSKSIWKLPAGFNA